MVYYVIRIAVNIFVCLNFQLIAVGRWTWKFLHAISTVIRFSTPTFCSCVKATAKLFKFVNYSNSLCGNSKSDNSKSRLDPEYSDRHWFQLLKARTDVIGRFELEYTILHLGGIARYHSRRIGLSWNGDPFPAQVWKYFGLDSEQH